MHWQRFTINETCLDNSNAEHPAEQCPFDDRTKELGLVVFLVMAVPAVVRFTRWKEKETYRKECEARIRNGIIAPEEFYWSVAEYCNEVEQPPIPRSLEKAAFCVLLAASLVLVWASLEGALDRLLLGLRPDLIGPVTLMVILALIAAWIFVLAAAIVVAVHIPGFLRGLRKNQPHT